MVRDVVGARDVRSIGPLAHRSLPLHSYRLRHLLVPLGGGAVRISTVNLASSLDSTRLRDEEAANDILVRWLVVLGHSQALP